MASGKVYTVAMIDQTVVADASLVVIHTAAAIGTAGSLIEIVRAWVSQHGSSSSQQLGIKIGTKASVFQTLTSTTPKPAVLGGSASGIAGGTAGAAATAGTDASAEGAGTFTDGIEDSFNILNGWLWVPTEDERIIVPPDTAVVLKLHGTPSVLTNWHAGLAYKELS